jgi:hypothetical protein
VEPEASEIFMLSSTRTQLGSGSPAAVSTTARSSVAGRALPGVDTVMRLRSVALVTRCRRTVERGTTSASGLDGAGGPTAASPSALELV